jgi:adenylyltransferase/sulfurtransferase
MPNEVNSERYSRQVILRELGYEGQYKLLQAKVLVVGAGGLGCPVLQYLAAAGVGTTGIIDDDIVDVSNLHRQVLFGVDDVGKKKATTAAYKLRLLNAGVKTEVFESRLTNTNAWQIISRYDLVVDGSDNLATRYLVSDACGILKKPLVYGSVFRFEGQVGVFYLNSNIGYRDVYPVQPNPGEVPDCSEAGVLGVLPGIIGSLMANEAIKIITGMGQLLSSRLLTYNCLTNLFYEIEIEPSDQLNGPASQGELEGWEYENKCAAVSNVGVLQHEDFDDAIGRAGTLIIDIREKDEMPVINEFDHISLPLSEIKKNLPTFDEDKIILFCQSGARSLQAAELIAGTARAGQQVFTLQNGIRSWKNKQRELPR